MKPANCSLLRFQNRGDIRWLVVSIAHYLFLVIWLSKLYDLSCDMFAISLSVGGQDLPSEPDKFTWDKVSIGDHCTLLRMSVYGTARSRLARLTRRFLFRGTLQTHAKNSD